MKQEKLTVIPKTKKLPVDTSAQTGQTLEHGASPDQYLTDGYICQKDILSNEELAEVNSILLEKINRYVKCESINAPEWVNFCKANTDIVTIVYDEMRDLDCLMSIGKLEKITDIVKQYIPIPYLYKKSPFRIDVPHEIKELAYWHQDDYYVKGGNNELTIWIPLQDTFIQQGCLSVMPGSHLQGKIPHTFISGKKHIPQNIYDQEIRLVEMRRGDILFFSSFLVHSSNINFSEQIRYSIQLRYSSINYNKDTLNV